LRRLSTENTESTERIINQILVDGVASTYHSQFLTI
jgi:hypothetical protein